MDICISLYRRHRYVFLDPLGSYISPRSSLEGGRRLWSNTFHNQVSFQISILTIVRIKGVSVRTIHPQEKVDTILLLDKPKDRHNLQVFLGMMVYFFAYIPFYAWITGPLFNLLKGFVKLEWTEIHSEAFKLCKQVLVNAPVRGYTKPGSPYRLYSDACDFGLAAILQQVQRIQLKDLK